jgi:hypothetical protein
MIISYKKHLGLCKIELKNTDSEIKNLHFNNKLEHCKLNQISLSKEPFITSYFVAAKMSSTIVKGVSCTSYIKDLDLLLCKCILYVLSSLER